jgi:hypothetical protein
MQRDLYVHDVAKSRWMKFDQQHTIFADAMRDGWTTGVAGWYNPYCHILNNVLDSCYWQTLAYPDMPPGKTATVVDAMMVPFHAMQAYFKPANTDSDLEVRAHTQEYKDITGAADSLIQDESISFAFLHIPIPHPPGIYDRKTGTLGVRGSYIDNLALSDRAVGDFLDAIQKTAAASRTILIVSSDHSWRVPMWRIDPSWTAEDERVSGGRFDPRPVLIIHFPGDGSDEMRTEPFPELATHDIIVAMLKNEIHSQSDLDRWLNEHQE